MNLAFLVEGKTELNLYPKWVSHFSPTPLSECTRGYQYVVANQFTIFNVNGIGKMCREIPAAIYAINSNPVFDYLVIVVDADDNKTSHRLQMIQGIINAALPLPANCQVKIIVQQACIETWFIGHTDHFLIAKECKDRGIKSFMAEYDAQNNDPEMMPNNRIATVHSIGAYHATFIKKMLKGVNETWHYNKATAHVLIDIPYLQRLEQRLKETPSHLQSFSNMIMFLKSL
jgi:hypothetical protein